MRIHPIQCKCGTVRGEVVGKGVNTRVVCYCKDCRAFARFLGNADAVLDAQGGTEIVQVGQPCVSFSHGVEHLAAVRLGRQGMVRWYADCCQTPIGNTMRSPAISFIGLIHSSLDRNAMDSDFGASVARVNTGSALGESKPKPTGFLGVAMRLAWIILSMRISGRYRKSALFDAQGRPLVRPTVLTAEERERLKNDG